MQDQPVLIVAATGKTSAEVVKKLQKRNVKVRALVRSATQAKEMFGESVEIFDGFDFDNPATMTAAMSGIDKLYLVSSPAVNAFEQTVSLVDAAKEAGVQHIVRLSVYRCDDTTKGFGATYVGKRHRAVEDYIESSGLAFTHLRPTWFHQNYEIINGQEIRENATLTLPLGNARFNSIDLQSIAEVAAAVLSEPGHENKIYELATEELTPGKIATLLSEATGRAIQYIDQMPSVAIGAALSYEEAKKWYPQVSNDPETLIQIGAKHWQQAKLGNITGITDTVEKLTGQKGRTFEQYVQESRQNFLPVVVGR